jgi:hypothetical protein
MLERLAPPGVAIIQVYLPNFPTGKAEQRQERNQLRQPKSPAREEWRE